MATITYKCDTCHRSVEKLENKTGITVFSKCIITDGCRGKLYKIDRNPDNKRESIPPFVSTLKEYDQRSVFYVHQQKTPANEWLINHNLNTLPSVIVYQANGTVVSSQDYSINLVDKNTIKVILNFTTTGRVHCISRSSTEKSISSVSIPEQAFKVTNGGTFVFAIPKLITKYDFVNYPIIDWIEGETYNAEKLISFANNKYSAKQTHVSNINNRPPNTSFWHQAPSIPYNLKDIKIRLKVIIQKPNDEPIVCIETLELENQGTAWSNWEGILTNKRKNYYIRTKNILDFETFDNAELKFTDIPNGTTIKFVEIDYGTGVFQPIPSKGLLLLLSKSPYSAIDKIKNRIIDIGEMIENNIDFFIYNTGDIFVSEENIEKVYPEIIQA